MARINDICTRNLLRNLASDEQTYFVVPWAAVVMRNSDEHGNLLTYRTNKEFLQLKTPYWIVLNLKLFQDEHGLYGNFVCSYCQCMFSVNMMTLDQRRENIDNLLCLHSVVATQKTDWREKWGEPVIPQGVLSFKFTPNLDTSVKPLKEDDYFLAAIQNEGDITIIFTLSKRNKAPFCSSCSTQKCRHYRQYKAFTNRNDALNDLANAPEGHDAAANQADHYDEIEPIDEYVKKYGHNTSTVLYPFNMNPDSQEVWLARLQGRYDLPDNIKPLYIEGSVCSLHGNPYDPDDENLIKQTKNVMIYSETSEMVHNTQTFGRPTIDKNCRCIQEADTNNLLLWHLGKGKMVDYLFLSCFVHNMRTNGVSKSGLLSARKERLNSIGVQTTLTQQDFSRACSGFVAKLVFHPDLKTFSCPKCGTTPEYLVADGKSNGPTKRKIEHIKEFSAADDDHNILRQGSKFKDRIFLVSNQERQEICSVLTEAMTMQDFLGGHNITSHNGRMIFEIIERIAGVWNGEIKKPYRQFISNVCKKTSVAGLIQVTHASPLNYLESFCNEELDVRCVGEIEKLELLQREMPALWPILTRILDLEGTKYLPRDVSRVVLILLHIRTMTFRNAAARNDEDYKDWPEPAEEHPTMFYPEFPIFRFPKLYTVSGKEDENLCNKNFPDKRDFSYGVFSIGCCCDLNITYGFEIMLSPESPHNFFRFLMTRDVDMANLEGVIFDFACGLDNYLLNREPREFQYLRCLVDGSHWQGQKKMRKPDRSGRGGHLGCSDGFNFNLYKKYLPGVLYSQGREQTHADMEKCVDSLGQMNYKNFMQHMRVFFGLTNLKHRGLI